MFIEDDLHIIQSTSIGIPHTNTKVYSNTMTPVVREAVKDYGATHDEELVVVPGTLREHNGTHTPQPSRSTPAGRTKKMLCASIIGLIAAVASSALLFLSVKASSRPARTGESFLLQASERADDDYCVPASGPYPKHANKQDDDNDNGPYVTCFTLRGGEDYCWSHSYFDKGDWKPCTPNGFGAQGWAFADNLFVQLNNNICGTPCTKFSKDMPHN